MKDPIIHYEIIESSKFGNFMLGLSKSGNLYQYDISARKWKLFAEAPELPKTKGTSVSEVSSQTSV